MFDNAPNFSIKYFDIERAMLKYLKQNCTRTSKNSEHQHNGHEQTLTNASNQQQPKTDPQVSITLTTLSTSAY